MVERAKELCEDLLVNVKEQHEEFKARPRYQGHNNGYGENRHPRGSGQGGSYGGHGGYGNENKASNNPVPSGDANAASAQDYAAQYAQYYGGADPYAAYGGYAK